MCYTYCMTTTAEQHATLWICTDCLILHANGDYPDFLDVGVDRVLEVKAQRGIEGGHLTLGMMKDEHECDYEVDWSAGHCECEDRSFSWSACDACLTRLGGSRHAATYWWKA